MDRKKHINDQDLGTAIFGWIAISSHGLGIHRNGGDCKGISPKYLLNSGFRNYICSIFVQVTSYNVTSAKHVILWVVVSDIFLNFHPPKYLGR